MVLNEWYVSVARLVKGCDAARGATQESLEEALDFAHIVFKCFFILVDKSSPF